MNATESFANDSKSKPFTVPIPKSTPIKKWLYILQCTRCLLCNHSTSNMSRIRHQMYANRRNVNMQEVRWSQWRQIFVQDIGRKWYKRSEGIVIGGVLLGLRAQNELVAVDLVVGDIVGFLLRVLEFLLLSDGLCWNNLCETFQAGSLKPCGWG